MPGRHGTAHALDSCMYVIKYRANIYIYGELRDLRIGILVLLVVMHYTVTPSMPKSGQPIMLRSPNYKLMLSGLRAVALYY